MSVYIDFLKNELWWRFHWIDEVDMMGKKKYLIKQDKDCHNNIGNKADPPPPVLVERGEFISIKTHPVVLHYDNLPINTHPDL